MLQQPVQRALLGQVRKPEASSLVDLQACVQVTVQVSVQQEVDSGLCPGRLSSLPRHRQLCRGQHLQHERHPADSRLTKVNQW